MMVKTQYANNYSSRLPADERRQQLTQVAVQLFSERGFDGTTMKEIAVAAGISEAVIYQHFPTKEDFYANVLDENTSRIFSRKWLDSLQDLAKEKSDEELFSAVGRKILEFSRQTHLVRLVLYSALERHELAKIFRVRQLLPIFEVLRSYIEKRQNDGAFQRIDAHTAARGFIGMLTHHAVVGNLFQCTLPHISEQRVVESLTQLTLSGLRSSETEDLKDTIF